MSSMTAPALATKPRRNFPPVPARAYAFLGSTSSPPGNILSLANGVVRGAPLRSERWRRSPSCRSCASHPRRLRICTRLGLSALGAAALLVCAADASVRGHRWRVGARSVPVRRRPRGGRVVAGTVAALLAIFLLAGYIGSRRLVVRNVTAESQPAGRSRWHPHRAALRPAHRAAPSRGAVRAHCLHRAVTRARPHRHHW